MSFASECREATDNYLETNKETIVNRIKQLCAGAAQNGEGRVFYAEPVSLEIIKELENEGLSVVRRGEDYLDGITISW